MVHLNEKEIVSRKRFARSIERAKQIAQDKKKRITVKKYGKKPSPATFQRTMDERYK